MLTTITANVRIAGLHCWPDAHDRRAYLRKPHRHMFHVSVTIPVTHDERDVEFHDLGDEVIDAVKSASKPIPDTGLRDFGTQSCEAIARRVMDWLEACDHTPTAVSVSEDGEFTATIERA